MKAREAVGFEIAEFDLDGKRLERPIVRYDARTPARGVWVLLPTTKEQRDKWNDGKPGWRLVFREFIRDRVTVTVVKP